MNVFRDFAEYYDLIYADKDYAGEARFVLAALRAAAGSGHRLLELGCGTGRHAIEFARAGMEVTGIDMSAEMVERATARIASSGVSPAPDLRVGDLRSLRLGEKFDYIVSLFHVLCYQTANEELEAAFQTAAAHLRPSGRFLFDFWYGPAVLADPPQVRVRRMRGSDFHLTRIAEPQHRFEANLVQVDYELLFERDSGGAPVRARECHAMRYLFLPEIRSFLARAGMELESSGGWMVHEPLSQRTWYGWACARAARSGG